jgi:hypothetical protein
MKSWNLSNFEDIAPNVLSFVNKDATVEMPSPRRRRHPVRTTAAVGLASTAVLIAAITLVSVQVHVSGSDDVLRLSSAVAISNVQTDRPPLTLLFGAKHSLKWDSGKEKDMLQRAALALLSQPSKQNEHNLIQSVLREDLPSDRSEAKEIELLDTM